jgi:hypothetical protein
MIDRTIPKMEFHFRDGFFIEQKFLTRIER